MLRVCTCSCAVIDCVSSFVLYGISSLNFLKQHNSRGIISPVNGYEHESIICQTHLSDLLALPPCSLAHEDMLCLRSLVIGGVDGAHERTEYDTCGSSRIQDVQAGFVAGFDDELLASDSGLRNVQKQSLRALQVPQFGLADLSSVKSLPHHLHLSTTALRVVATAPKCNPKAFETCNRR